VSLAAAPPSSALAQGQGRADRQRSGGEFVLVDEPAEEVTIAERSGAAAQARRHSQSGRCEVKAAMRSSPVAVPDVLGKDSLEVMPGNCELVVEAVLADGAHPALSERVRVRRTHRGEHRRDADRREDHRSWW
jgi:hypothetical protein